MPPRDEMTLTLPVDAEQAAAIERRLRETAWRALASPRQRLFALAEVRGMGELASRLGVSKTRVLQVLRQAEERKWMSPEWAERFGKAVHPDPDDPTRTLSALDIFVLFGCERQAARANTQFTLPIDPTSEKPAA